eukprot:239619-Amphidinium_carterae.1
MAAVLEFPFIHKHSGTQMSPMTNVLSNSVAVDAYRHKNRMTERPRTMIGSKSSRTTMARSGQGLVGTCTSS